MRNNTQRNNDEMIRLRDDIRLYVSGHPGHRQFGRVVLHFDQNFKKLTFCWISDIV